MAHPVDFSLEAVLGKDEREPFIKMNWKRNSEWAGHKVGALGG